MTRELDKYPEIQKIFMLLIFVEMFFLVSDTLLYTFKYAIHSEVIKLFDITDEANLPTWFSSTQALAVAGVAYFIMLQKKMLSSSIAKQNGWLVVTFFFLYLAIDDAAQIHERLSTALNSYLGGTEGFSSLSKWLNFFPSYHWQVIFLPVLGGVGLYMLNLMYREFGKSLPLYFFISGGLFYVFAVLLDYIEGNKSHYILIRELTYFTVSDIVHILQAIEEVVEMFGTSLILVAFLIYSSKLKRMLSQKGRAN